MLGRIETASGPMAALSAFEPEDRVVASASMEGQGAGEAIAPGIAVGPDAHGVSIGAPVCDSDFCDTLDEEEKKDRLSAYEEDTA